MPRGRAKLPDLDCNPSPLQHSIPVQIFVAIAFTSLIIAALIGNLVVMWIICSSKVMRKSFNFFLFNIAVADFLMALMNAGTTWTFNFYYDWWYGDFCPINHFFGVVPTCVSIFTMMVVSYDRCVAVVNPLRKRPLSSKRTFLIIIMIWIIASLIGLPAAISARVETEYFYSSTLNKIGQRQICHNAFSYKFLYDTFLFTIQYVIPLFILSFTYGRIVFTFKKDDFYANVQATKSHQNIHAKQRVVKMLGLVVLIFMLAWLPYQLHHLLLERLNINFEILSYSYMFFYWLAMSACAYNPIIYCYFNVRFRIGFRYAFRWLPCVKYSQQEYEHSELFPEATRLLTSNIKRNLTHNSSLHLSKDSVTVSTRLPKHSLNM
uniref:G-protein coupled receptors family 1 profile domain-containing protein n=1 Tax=Acrobeloides nanus TaxID=290746 RepID=A0A914EMU0_9BILA